MRVRVCAHVCVCVSVWAFLPNHMFSLSQYIQHTHTRFISHTHLHAQHTHAHTLQLTHTHSTHVSTHRYSHAYTRTLKTHWRVLPQEAPPLLLLLPTRTRVFGPPLAQVEERQAAACLAALFPQVILQSVCVSVCVRECVCKCACVCVHACVGGYQGSWIGARC